MQSKSKKTTSSGRLFGYLKLQISLRVSISYVIKTQLQFYTAISFIIQHLIHLENILNYNSYTINHVALHISFT